MYFNTRELTIYLFLFILIWYLELRVRVKNIFWWTHCSPSSSNCLCRRCCHRCRCRHRRLGRQHHRQECLIKATTVSLELQRSEQRHTFTRHFYPRHRWRRVWRRVWPIFRWRSTSLWSSSYACSGFVLIILVGVRLSFSVFLSPLWLFNLLLCHHLPWILLYLILQVHLLLLMNFLNCMRIVKTLVLLHLLHIQVSLLLAHPLQFSWSLGSRLRCHRSYYW